MKKSSLCSCCRCQVQAHDPAAFVNYFHTALSQYLHALQAIVPVFNYMVNMHACHLCNMLQMTVGHILGTARPTNFKLGMQMEYDDQRVR